MPHFRQRHIQETIKKVARFSPLVGVLGHRQVGKTTLLEKICKEYFTLDAPEELKLAKIDPVTYIKERSDTRVAIDECQQAPELFPAFKEHVRKYKTPGQFFLSGSVRFTSRKAIRESLTGRIVNLDLLPFTLTELMERPLSEHCKTALENSSLESLLDKLTLSAKEFKTRTNLMETYFSNGGLPGVCFIRNPKLRELRIDEQLRTLLDRDLRMIQKTTLLYQDIKNVCQKLARSQGTPIEFTSLQRQTGISQPTLKKLLYSLEAIFLIRTLPIEGGRKGHVIYFEDQAEAHWLSTGSFSQLQKLSHFCFTQIRAQFEYRLGERAEMFQYRTRGGAFVPLAYRSASGILGVIPVESAQQASSVLSSANSFLKSYINSKILILHPDKDSFLLQPRVLVAPVIAMV